MGGGGWGKKCRLKIDRHMTSCPFGLRFAIINNYKGYFFRLYKPKHQRGLVGLFPKHLLSALNPYLLICHVVLQ